MDVTHYGLRLAELLERQTGVRIIEGEPMPEAWRKIYRGVEYLAALAVAGNELAVSLDRGDQEDAVAAYIKAIGKAVQERDAVCGVRPMREGAGRFEIG